MVEQYVLKFPDSGGFLFENWLIFYYLIIFLLLFESNLSSQIIVQVQY